MHAVTILQRSIIGQQKLAAFNMLDRREALKKNRVQNAPENKYTSTENMAENNLGMA